MFCPTRLGFLAAMPLLLPCSKKIGKLYNSPLRAFLGQRF
jgi:hypothetical protein